MKKLILAIIIGAMPVVAFADTSVNGYFKKNGTYVQPHMRSSPDGYAGNNWSTRGNVNPYTGARGTQQNTFGNTFNSGSTFNNGGGYRRVQVPCGKYNIC